MEWHHLNSPRKKRFNSTPSAEKVMATVWLGWGAAEVVIFVELFTWSNHLTHIGEFKRSKLAEAFQVNSTSLKCRRNPSST
jgi:hypothetical protein